MEERERGVGDLDLELVLELEVGVGGMKREVNWVGGQVMLPFRREGGLRPRPKLQGQRAKTSKNEQERSRRD